ncbi:MAG: HAMP domain-containing histidine kinase [Polyangiaceae bacterium]|nr:HAMP domain-containing histidine kinase [Polyangiaceae bacterium]
MSRRERRPDPAGRRARRLPLSPLVPLLVVAVGVATAALLAIGGLGELRSDGRRVAAARARLLAETLAARARAVPRDDRPPLLAQAARRSGAELLLVDHAGGVQVDETLRPPERDQIRDLLVRGEGDAETQLGTTRFVAAPLGPPVDHLSVVAFVRAPEAPFASGSLVASIAALTALLVGGAALVAWALARDVHDDVDDLRRRVVAMASEEDAPAGTLVPPRSADQIGLLVSEFDGLVERFTAAARAYRQDLSLATEADRERGAFLAALSHELRNPLNSVLGFTDVLLAEVDGPLSDDARESLEVVRSSGAHLRALIEDVLDLSALESGELTLERREVDAHEVAAEVVREVAVQASAKGLRVDVLGPGAPVWADPRRLRQILGNLVGNAVKFTSSGGVQVRIEPRAGAVALHVIDSGPGIAPAAQAAIFEEYAQAGDAAARRKGTGLGLAITRRLVRMHGGTIELESELGAGSHFVVALPSDPESEPLATASSPRSSRAPRSSRSGAGRSDRPPQGGA